MLGRPDVLMLAVNLPSLPTLWGWEARTVMDTEEGEPLAMPETTMLYVPAGTLLEKVPTWFETLPSIDMPMGTPGKLPETVSVSTGLTVMLKLLPPGICKPLMVDL